MPRSYVDFVTSKPKHPPMICEQAHRCNWTMRNPRKWLTLKQFRKLITDMIDRGDQKIICPGCQRPVYIELKIYAHNGVDAKGKIKQGPPRIEDWEE